MIFLSDSIYREVLGEKEGYVESKVNKNKVLLTGRKPFQNSLFIDKVKLEIYGVNKNENLEVSVPYSGYYFQLFLGDFNNDGLDEILIRGSKIRSGGGAIGLVYAFIDGRLKSIFNQEEFNTKYEYSGKYLEDYKVFIKSENLDKKFIIDISLKARPYLNLLYHSNGKLKEEKSITVSHMKSIYPVKPMYFDKYELIILQSINGVSDVDNLGMVQIVFNLINNRFNITKIGVTSYLDVGDFFSLIEE